jgi:hypothetical protein
VYYDDLGTTNEIINAALITTQLVLADFVLVSLL